ncbi:MAG: DinB family protein [bacterium]
MAIRDLILPEFDHEMANTRKTLERVPTDKFDWTPHEKSFNMQSLASHLANIPAWTPLTLNQDKLDFAPEGGERFTTPQAGSTAELLEFFDKNVAEAREALAAVTDEQLHSSWTLLAGGQEILTLPRIAVLRSFILSHTIHHRAQLALYLRLNDLPVPALYGPSADEQGM